MHVHKTKLMNAPHQTSKHRGDEIICDVSAAIIVALLLFVHTAVAQHDLVACFAHADVRCIFGDVIYQYLAGCARSSRPGGCLEH